MNALENLPKYVTYKKKDYFLRVWVNAWGELCIGYKALGEEKIILSYVVQKGRSVYIPKIIEETEHSGLNEHIGNCETLDDCIEAVNNKIKELGLRGE